MATEPVTLKTLLDAYGEASFACGEWTSHDEEPYEALHKRDEAARAAVNEAIQKRESTLRACLDNCVKYDARLTRREAAPTGDDYNALMAFILSATKETT